MRSLITSPKSYHSHVAIVMNIPGRLIRPNFNSQQAIYICKFLIMQQHQHIHVLVYKHSWKHISILSFRPLQQTSIPHMEKHIHGNSTCYKFSVFTIYCAILENNDMTEPFPWKMLVKVLMLLLLVSTSRCFSNYILINTFIKACRTASAKYWPYTISVGSKKFQDIFISGRHEKITG